MLANQNIYRGRRGLLTGSIIDLIQINDENFQLFENSLSWRKMNTDLQTK